jgi:hypothetical protein
LRRHGKTDADLNRVDISLVGTDPHQTWTLFCDETERFAREPSQAEQCKLEDLENRETGPNRNDILGPSRSQGPQGRSRRIPADENAAVYNDDGVCHCSMKDN